MSLPETAKLEEVATVAKGAQILNLVKENQLITAVIVFFLWQAGALAQGINLLGGVC
jgi:hypothetical protein